MNRYFVILWTEAHRARINCPGFRQIKGSPARFFLAIFYLTGPLRLPATFIPKTPERRNIIPLGSEAPRDIGRKGDLSLSPTCCGSRI